MSKRSLEQFSIRTEKEAKNIAKDLEKHLNTIRFQMERQGKKNATDDFYQPLTRAGFVRDYKLTGRLRNSINARLRRSKDSVEVLLQAGGFSGGSSVEYAAELEFGSARIKPFFFLGRAVKQTQNDLTKDLQKFLQIELKDL
jgi:hypothetical protein